MPIIRPGDPIWIQGKAYAGQHVRFLDEAGHELHHVTWIDTDAQIFSQQVRDEEGQIVRDPDDHTKVLEIIRYGRVRFEVRQ